MGTMVGALLVAGALLGPVEPVGRMQLWLVAVGFLVVAGLARVFPREWPYLTATLLIWYGARTVFTILVFLTSYYSWPVFPEMQERGGLWNFVWDPLYYDQIGNQISQAIAGSSEWPQIGAERTYFAYVGLLYWLLGPNPLNVVLVNSFWALPGGCAAYFIARRVGCNPKGAFLAAGAAGLWPSALVWSSQMLKDTVVGSLVLVVVLGFQAGLHDDWKRSWIRSWIVPLVLAVVTIAAFRSYVALFLLASCMALVLLRGLTSRFDLRAVAGAVATLSVLLVMTIWVGQLKLDEVTARWLRGTPSGQTGAVAGPHGSRSDGGESAGESEPAPGQPDPTDSSTVQDMLVHAQQELRRTQPEYVGIVRDGFGTADAGSMVDESTEIRTLLDFVAYYPRALAIALLAPFPPDWFKIGYVSGVMRQLASIEMVLLYAVLGLLVLEIWKHDVLKLPVFGFVVVWVVLGTGYLAAAIPNVGTVFRLRLQFILPLIIVTLSSAAARRFPRSEA